MTDENPITPAEQITNYITDNASFEGEQDVATKSWYLPSRTVENLRSYIIGEYGTTHHIGAFCVRAMRNWMQDTPTDDSHQTWGHLKNDYDYSGVDVSNWNYRHYHDYTEIDKDDKTALGFSAPVTVIDQFTDELSKNEYGSELANAVEAELLKLAQISQMQAHIQSGGAERTDDDPVTSTTAHKIEIDDDGNRADLSTITVEDTIELKSGDIYDFAKRNDIEWENRRGLLTAIARSRKATPKNFIYSQDEFIFDVTANRSKRKDFNAILEQARKGDEALCIAPAKVVMEKMGVNKSLESKAGLTGRRQPLTFDDDENFSEFKQIVYNSEKTTSTEMWNQFGESVCDIGYQLSEVDWNVRDTVTAVYKGIHYRNALQKYLPVIHSVQDELESIEDEELNAIKNRLDFIVESLEDALAEVMTYTIGAGGKGIEEAYEEFKEVGETPTSIEFDTQGRMKQSQGFEV